MEKSYRCTAATVSVDLHQLWAAKTQHISDCTCYLNKSALDVELHLQRTSIVLSFLSDITSVLSFLDFYT